MISDDKKAYIRAVSSEDLRDKVATGAFGGENAAYAKLVLAERDREAAEAKDSAMADAALRSAAAAEVSAKTARWALLISGLALAVALASLLKP